MATKAEHAYSLTLDFKELLTKKTHFQTDLSHLYMSDHCIVCYKGSVCLVDQKFLITAIVEYSLIHCLAGEKDQNLLLNYKIVLY